MKTTKTYAEDIQVPTIINHRTFLGSMQTKRVDRIEFDATCDPRVAKALGIDHTVPLVQLVGDTVYADGTPMGEVRGWQTYIEADAIVEIVTEA